MIDTAFVEQHMRDVNPVPGIEDLDAEELSRAVAAAQTRMAATKRDKAKDPLSRPWRSSRGQRAWAFAAAFILILASIGVLALLLRGDNPPVADEPAPPAVKTTPDVTTPADREALAITYGWQRVATVAGQPWVDEINGAAALPSGGFVAATAWSPAVMWSPNGTDWFEGDPQHTIESRTVGIAVVGDQVVVLALPIHETSPAVLWIGDPTTGSWEQMSLDTNGFPVQPGGVAMASNESTVLLTAELDSPPGDDGTSATAADPEVVLWLVDPKLRTSTQTTLSLPTGREYPSPSVTWFDGRWLMVVEVEGSGEEQGEPVIENSLWTSLDGVTWSEIEITPEFRDHPGAGFIPGTRGLVATTYRPITSESDGIWFSPNGADWSLILDDMTSNGGVYSDAFGFVLSSSHWLSPDGALLGQFPLPQQDFFILAASNGALLGVDGWGPPEDRSLVDLWLYRDPGDE